MHVRVCYIFKCTESGPKTDSSSSIVDIVYNIWILNVYKYVYTFCLFFNFWATWDLYFKIYKCADVHVINRI